MSSLYLQLLLLLSLSVALLVKVDAKVDASLQTTVPGPPLLTLEAADAMATACIAEAIARNFKDISVFVVDYHGRVVVSKTQLGCPRLIPSIALGKAGAAIGTHSSSRALKDKYTLTDRTPQLIAMTTISDSNKLPFIAVPGGVLCRDQSGNVVGAIGVSGASADEDEHCAVTGAQSVGFVTEPARTPLLHLLDKQNE